MLIIALSIIALFNYYYSIARSESFRKRFTEMAVLSFSVAALSYKLKLARHVLLNEDGKGCAATDTGTLDFTHISMSSTRKFTFAQGEPELPSGYVVPEPTTPEEAPAEETADSTAEGAADETAPPADAAAQPADDD